VFQRRGTGSRGAAAGVAGELHNAFTDGWEVESVQPTRIDVNPEFTKVKFSEGGPKAWFAVVRRTG
jgi:hypothetical protein